MDDLYQQSISLPAAAQSSNVNGALQQMLMQRIRAPEQMRPPEERAKLLSEYQQELRQPPMGGYSGTEHALYNWIGNMGKTTPANAVARGVAAGGDWVKANAQGMQDGRTLAAKAGYEDSLKDEKMGLEELRALSSLTKAGGRGAGQTVKMDKDGNMVVYDPVTQETKVVHSSQGAAYQNIWGKAYQQAVDQNMADPEGYAHKVASDVLGKAPSASNIAPVKPLGGIGVGPANSPSAVQPGENKPSTLEYKDLPEEARKKEFATGLEKSAMKVYDETIVPEAMSGDKMLTTVGMIRQIPRTQDAFAPYREKLGSVMNAIGMDGTMVKEAQNIQQIRPLLNRMANSILNAAKGPQTDQDAIRAYGEFMKIEDTQAAADFMYEWAEENARRSKMKKQMYDLAAKEKGTMREGENYWNMTDYAKAQPVTVLNGKPWAFSKWRDKFIKSNPTAEVKDAIEAWNNLTGAK